MSYTIEYSPHKNKKYPKVVHHRRKMPPVLIAVVVILLLFVVSKWDVLGARSRYYAALETMADRIREGTQIGQSITQCFSALNE